MKEFFKKMFKMPRIFKRDMEEDSWRTPKTALEVISKAELDGMQRETISDLQAEGVLDPKALFYIYKYIDAKFDKKDFNVEDRFIAKANKLDQFYSEGRAEVYAEFSGYKTLFDLTKDADRRLRSAIIALDPETELKASDCRVEDDYDSLKSSYNKLPTLLNWEEQ